MPDDKRLAVLEAKWLDGSISPQEEQEYANWYNTQQDDPVEIPSSLYASKEIHRKALLAGINRRRKAGAFTTPVRLLRVTAAAAVLMVVATGAWFLLSQSHKLLQKTVHVNTVVNDVMPGGKKATLTLANGEIIILDSAANGLLAQQPGVSIRNIDGEITYAQTGPPGEMVYNTLRTNKGEQYPITLSDGTRVWLNASSSLRFPASFPGNERKVEITGEAYFEVAKNAVKPFVVAVNSMNVQVLGTSFNINSYEDENAIHTTLLEGSVKVNNSMPLHPGQQYQLSRSGKWKIIDNADTERAVAWKNGLFKFSGSSITSVMRELEKWYDIEVRYEGAVTTDKFAGSISRKATLREVLLILQYSKVHFRLEQNKLTVMP